MSHPPAPWKIQGYALQTVHLLDINRVRSQVPAELEIVSLWPGKTVGGLYVASYGAGSTLQYNELIVVSALTRYAGEFGFWISHIYVDHPDSVSGGRDIWGLPKQLAQFQWNDKKQSAVSVYQGEQLLCQLGYEWQIPGWRQPFTGLVFSAIAEDLLRFQAHAEINLSWVGGSVQIPRQSPFAPLNFDQPLVSVYGRQVQVTVDAPQVIGTVYSPMRSPQFL